LLASLTEQAHSRRGLRAVARLSLDGPAGSGRAKQILILERPARLRVEVLGFLNQTVAVLVTDGERYQLFRGEDGSLREGPMHPRLLEEIAGVRLSPEEAVEVLLGSPALPEAQRIAGGALLADGVVRVDLGSESDTRARRLEFDRDAQLRRLELADPLEGVLWEAHFDDYRRVGGTRFAHSIELRFPATGARAQLSFREVELNPELSADIFVLDLPARVGERGGQG
jgi:hypothetical protein